MEKRSQPPPERAIFLSDAHLNQDDIHSRRFLELADRAAAEKVPMYLLGDMFDLWFGTRDLTFKYQRPIIDHLRELRRGGLRLVYVEGNRDFYLKREHEGTTFDAVSEGDLPVRVGDQRVHLSHGDTVNKADFSYRFWKGISKSRFANRTVAHLPSVVILPMGDWIERKLKRYNRRHKESFPETDCRNYAVARFEAEADFVVLGHFHQECLMKFPHGDSFKVLAVLPAWKERWRYFHIAADGTHGFRSFHPGEPLVP